MSWQREAGLKYNPFDTAINSAEDVFESSDLLHVQESVIECVNERQLLLIVAPAGGGKTTTGYDLLADEAHRQGKQLLLVRDFTLTYEKLRIGHIVEALIQAILKASGSSEHVKRSANGRYYQLQRLLGEYAKSHEVVLVLEDGHVLPGQLLVNLKRLRELRFAMHERLLSVIVLAHPQIDAELLEAREVKLRTEIVRMHGLSSEEVREYVAFKCARAGADINKLVTKDALNVIAGAVRWPQDVNRVLTELLRAAVEIGELPVSKELALKHCGQMSSLGSLRLLAGKTIPEILSWLKGEKQIKVDKYVLRRLLAGQDPRVAGLKEAVKEFLLPFAAGQAALFDETRTRLTKTQQVTMDKILLMLADFNYDLDWAGLAEATELRPSRVHQILITASDPTDLELSAIHREVKKLHTELKRVRKVA